VYWEGAGRLSSYDHDRVSSECSIATQLL